MYMFILGVLFGSGLVLAFQTLQRGFEQHRINKRRRFILAVQEAAYAQSNDGWGTPDTRWDLDEAAR